VPEYEGKIRKMY